MNIYIEYIGNVLDSDGVIAKEFIDYYNCIYIIGDEISSNNSKNIAQRLLEEKKYFQKIRYKHHLGLTKEMINWLANIDINKYGEDFYYSIFSNWYISEKFNQIETFINKIKARPAKDNILILTEDCKYEYNSIRSILGSILQIKDNRYRVNFCYEEYRKFYIDTYYTFYKKIESQVYDYSNGDNECGVKIRIYPNKIQEWELNQTINSCNFMFNELLKLQQEKESKARAENKELPSFKYDTAQNEIIDIKDKETNKWLIDVVNPYTKKNWSPDSTAYQQAARALENAFNKFYYEGKGYPRYKSRNNIKNSYTAIRVGTNIKLNPNTAYSLKLPKITGFLRTRHKANFMLYEKCNISRVTVSKTSSNKWYASICFTKVPNRISNYIYKPDGIYTNKVNSAVGIDLGITKYATCADSNGSIYSYPNPNYYDKYNNRMENLQKELSRKQYDKDAKYYSSNYKKSKVKLAKLHEKVKFKRKDYQNKISNALTNYYTEVYVETLSISSMRETREKYLSTKKSLNTRNRHLTDAAFYEFTRQLEYKCKWSQTKFVKVASTFPSTKLCTQCETVHPTSLESCFKTWKCSNPLCPSHKTPNGVIDRDVNAAINILREGLRINKSEIISVYPAFIHVIRETKSITEEEYNRDRKINDIKQEGMNFIDIVNRNNESVKFGK